MIREKYFVFSQRLAGWLMLQGFVLLDMREDKCNRSRNVYVFRESDALVKMVDEYKKRKLQILGF